MRDISFTLRKTIMDVNEGGAQKKKVSYTFSDKEAKFCKLKYFLIILMKHFFSFYNILFSILN